MLERNEKIYQKPAGDKTRCPPGLPDGGAGLSAGGIRRGGAGLDGANAYAGRTIWRVFDSRNNDSTPKIVPVPTAAIQYWYGSLEKKAGAWEINYAKKTFPETRFVEVGGLDHAEYAPLHPAAFA